MEEVWIKKGFSTSKLKGICYALNPYIGCEHACVYCYSPDILHISRKEWRNVKIKRNLPNVLAKELRNLEHGTVGIGTVTDPYQPLEKRYGVTRRCLEQMLRTQFPITIQTKSDLILRDLDLLKKFEDVDVGITITTIDERARTVFEPGAPPVDKRIEALNELVSRGIETWVFIGPVLPYITESGIGELSEKIGKVDYVYIDRLRLRAGGQILSDISKAIEDNYPQRAEKMIEEIRRGEGKFEKIREVLESNGLEVRFEYPFKV